MMGVLTREERVEHLHSTLRSISDCAPDRYAYDTHICFERSSIGIDISLLLTQKQPSHIRGAISCDMEQSRTRSRF